MNGLLGAVSRDNVAPLLIEGLRRLDRPQRDAAGMALVRGSGGDLALHHWARATGGARQLAVWSRAGIAHTRVPDATGVELRVSGGIAVAHSGHIGNHRVVRAMLEAKGYDFETDTGDEVAAHLLHCLYRKIGSLFHAVHTAGDLLGGRYTLAAVVAGETDGLVAARHGGPLVIGVAATGLMVASHAAALASWTQRNLFLEDGDVAELRGEGLRIMDRRGHLVLRSLRGA